MNETIRVYVVDYPDRNNLYMRYADPVTGKHQAKSTGTASKKEAARVAAKWEADLQEGRYKPPSKVTWDEFRTRFEDEKLRGLSTNYAAVMHSTFSHLEKLNIQRLCDVNASAISRYQAELRSAKVSESTIRTYLKHLKAALSWARRVGLLTVVPEFEMPKRARKTSKMKGRAISTEEFERMLEVVDKICPHDATNWKRYLTGLWLSGLRLSESLTLSWDEDSDITVDLTGKHPRFRIWAEGQKRHRDELLPMTPDFAQWLLRTPETGRSGRVYTLWNSHKAPLTANTVGRVVSDIGEAAGVVVDKAKGKFATAHDLRRSFATRWSREVKPATLRSLMRHADIKTTMSYYVDQNADEVASELWESHLGKNSALFPLTDERTQNAK